jgi:hypothetical protein
LRRSGLGGNFWPSEQQELLLRAALLDADQAAAAWRALRPRFDLDHLEDGSYCLMPLLATRLPSIDPDDPIVPRLKGIYRHTWYRNRIAHTRMAELLGVLDAAGIDTIMLKGVARGVRYYPNPTDRPIEELEVMVQATAAASALQALSQAGWRCRTRATGAMLRQRQAVRIEAAEGRGCTLRWQTPPEFLLSDRPDTSADDFWKATVEVEIDGVRGRALDPTAELLDTCVTDPNAGAGAPVQWAADAGMILQRAGPDVDWATLTSWATRRQATLRLRDGLAYLRQAIDAPVPPEALARLDAVQPTRRDRFVHWAGGRRNGLLGGLPHAVALHARATAGQGVVATVVGLPRSLRDAWELDHVYDVPGHAFRKGWRRLSPAANSGGMNLPSR